MAITIIKKTGEKTVVEATDPPWVDPGAKAPAGQAAGSPLPPPSGKAALAPAFVKPVPEAIRMFCDKLADLPAKDMSMKTEVWVAYHMGYGSHDAREKLLQKNVFTAEWPNLIAWFARPEVGDTLLPPDATWEIHRVNEGGDANGWATLSIGGATWDAKARTPWAAFAICMLKARSDGKLQPGTPP